MTNEELAVEIQNGKTEYLPILWNQVERFIALKANKIYTKLLNDPNLAIAIEFDDLYDSGYFAMLQAVKYFKPETGYTFLTFLGLPLRNVFNDIIFGRSGTTHLKKCDPINLSISLDTPVGTDTDLTIGDTIADDTDVAEEVLSGIEQQELHNDLEKALKELTEPQEQVLRLKYYEGLSISQIGEELGVTPSRVQQIRTDGLRELRRRKDLEKYIDKHTDFYLRTSVKSQKSPVELIVQKREDLRARLGLKI